MVRDKNKLKTIVTKLDSSDNYQMLLSVVYKNGAYWVYHTKTLYKADGEIDNTYNHFQQAWQVVRLSNLRSKKELTTDREIQDRNRQKKNVRDMIQV